MENVFPSSSRTNTFTCLYAFIGVCPRSLVPSIFGFNSDVFFMVDGPVNWWFCYPLGNILKELQNPTDLVYGNVGYSILGYGGWTFALRISPVSYFLKSKRTTQLYGWLFCSIESISLCSSKQESQDLFLNVN